MDRPDERGIEDEPAGDGQLKETPANRDKRNNIFGGASGLSGDTFFFFGHPLCDLNAFILFLDFMVTHNNHLNGRSV